MLDLMPSFLMVIYYLDLELFVMKKQNSRGFTLIEILVVLGIIAILAAIVIIAINPARQFAQARDSERMSHVNSILNAIGQRLADNKGIFSGTFSVGGVSYTCPDLTVTTLTAGKEYNISSSTDALSDDTLGLACLVPTYLPSFPSDPTYTSGALTLYTLSVDAGGRITIRAPRAEINSPILVTR